MARREADLRELHRQSLLLHGRDAVENRLREMEAELQSMKIHEAKMIEEVALERSKPLEIVVQNAQTEFRELLEAVLAMACMMGQVEEDASCVEAAQRMVIKALLTKLQRKDPGFELNYVPKTESDKKIWYLELVESQIEGTEAAVKGLQNFVKKLTIEVQGSLQSAAQIKAAAMDLASCSNQAADEVE